MSYSDVEYCGLGFQGHDVDLAVWMHYVVQAIDLVQDRPKWLDELRQDWRDQASGGFGFGIVPGLDRHLTADRKDLMLTLFRRAVAMMEQHGETMTVEELNSLKPKGPNAVFAEDLPMKHFQEVGRKAVDLLEGRNPEP